METASPAVSALKKLALLEPDLIMPAIMERAVPSLQGLEETQRTPAVTFAVASLAQPLTGRQVWRIGGVYIGDIFQLLLPGIDLNDPGKTGLTCMAISNMVDFIRLGDISEVENGDDVTPGARALRTAPRQSVRDDPDDPVQHELEDLSPEEVNERIRFGTSIFRDWVPEFLGRVLLLFGNLPEEGGKSGRAGGKSEQMTLQSVLVRPAQIKIKSTLTRSTHAEVCLPLLTTSFMMLCSTRFTSISPRLAGPTQLTPLENWSETSPRLMLQRSSLNCSLSVDKEFSPN